MPLPLSDVTQAYRSAPEKTDQALTKVRRAMLFEFQCSQQTLFKVVASGRLK